MTSDGHVYLSRCDDKLFEAPLLDSANDIQDQASRLHTLHSHMLVVFQCDVAAEPQLVIKEEILNFTNSE